MNNKNVEIIEILKETYPDAKCSLNFENPFQLVIAVMLSAQCTDERVNQVTPKLFQKYPTVQILANVSIKNIEEIIRPCGFYKNKAKNIKDCCKKIIEDYNGQVPKNIEELTTLAGIGRKSANVIMLEAFGQPCGIAVDTHAKRISNRLGLSSESDPIKIEQDLIKIFPHKYLKDINHLFIWHGRNTCTARNPKCEKCTIAKFCKTYNE